MEKWFAYPENQFSRKALNIAIEEFGGSDEPSAIEVRNLDHRTERIRAFEIPHAVVQYLDGSIRAGEHWEFRFFRQRNEFEMVVEQTTRSKEPKKVTDLKRALKAAQQKKAR